MKTAQLISIRLSRQVWVVRSPQGAIRFHLFYRPGMGDLIAIAIGNETVNMDE